MQYEAFVKETRARTGLPSNGEAIDAGRSVVDTLLECLPGTLSEEVSARLPRALAPCPCCAEWTPGERMTVSEFVARVSEREGVDEAAAFCHTQAVLQMLGAALGYALLEKVRAELPTEFEEFWGCRPEQAHLHQPVNA